MRITDLVKIAVYSIDRNRTRSLLTMLGIIIGVGSVIAMLAIGKGSSIAIKEQISSLGTNMIVVMPGAQEEHGRRMAAGTSVLLKEDDALAIANHCPSVAYVSPLVQIRAQIVFGGKNWQSNIVGIYASYLHISNYQISHGSMFDEATSRSLQKQCVIGQTVAKELFVDDHQAIGQTIRINKIPFVVTGILAEKGQGTFGQDQDDIILAPFPAVQKRLIGMDHVSQIIVSARSEELIEQAKKEISTTLIEIQHLVRGGEAKFNIRSLSEITNIFGSVSQVLTLLLASIAGISLLVGGIGIMNIMLVSVTERTKEIGLRLAVGATEGAILTQFLGEAILLSLTGGLVGIIFGYALSSVASSLMGWPVIISPSSIILAFGFAFIVGIIFGYFPARKASKLHPIEALRYE